MPSFELQFDPAAIPALADRYAYADDAGPRAAGVAAAARGYYDEAGFLEVCNWKAPRARSKFALNSRVVIEDTTRRAFAAEPEDERMEALLTLAGIGVPMALTLLQFAFPEKYPILDVRALEALGRMSRTVYPVSFWVRYLKACRGLAAQHDVGIRTLDKAHWQWSKERSSAVEEAH